jgi:membrane protein
MSDQGEARVRDRFSLWEFGGLTPFTLAKRTFSEAGKDDVFGHAAELSYYFLLALFPALFFMLTILGLMAGPGSELRAQMMTYMARVMPESAADLVSKTLNEIHQKSSALKALFGALTALWAATGGIDAISKTLNIAYDLQETRSWIRKKLTSVSLTFGLALLVIGALALIAFGGNIGEFVAAKVGLGTAFTLAWKILQWPVALGAMFLAFAMIYYFAPNLKAPQWSWISPGAAVGVVVWLLASSAFSLYLKFFNSYSKTYGSLGAVIILMLWFYLTGMAILIGGEVNSEITKADHDREIYERKLERIERESAA